MADRTYYRPSSKKPSAGFGKRLLWIFVIGLITAAVVSMSTQSGRDRATPPPGNEPMARMSARKLQAHAAERAVVAGAGAAQKALAASRLEEKADPGKGAHAGTVIEPDRTEYVSLTSRASDASPAGRPRPAIRITRVRSSTPQPTHARALNEAIIEARLRIAEKLQSLDEPIHVVPSIDAVRNEYLRPESVTEIPLKPEDRAELEAKNLDPNRVWVEIDVELTDDQVRELRSNSRLEGTSLFAVVAFVLVLALFGFLRLDAWTKGYLTAGIGIAVAAAAGGAVALLFLTR